jgi:hypothetical protein
MAPSLVGDKEMLSIWERSRKRLARLKRGKGPGYNIADHQREEEISEGVRAELDFRRV